MKKALLFFILFPVVLQSQETGILFDKSPNWKAVLAKARAENKYIFVDCYTTWCAPCKSMEEFVFTDEQVAAYYNSNFINVKIQFDSTGADSKHVQGWYKDSKTIDKTYKIQGYPSYLFFDPKGNLVNRAIGGMGSDKFITNARNSFDPATQYWTQLKKYHAGKKDPAFLRSLSELAFVTNDIAIAKSAGYEYIAAEPDPYTKENLAFLISLTQSSKDKGFSFFMQNPGKINAVLGKGKAEVVVKEIVWNEDVLPPLLRSVRIVDGKMVFEDQGNIDWNGLSKKIRSKYPVFADELEARAKVFYYQDRGKWAEFAAALSSYMGAYAENMTPDELNDYAAKVFYYCKDAGLVAQAMQWSKRSFAAYEKPAYLRTYANLLYKSGKIQEAIEWQNKAIALVTDEGTRKKYKDALIRMEKGEKTWEY